MNIGFISSLTALTPEVDGIFRVQISLYCIWEEKNHTEFLIYALDFFTL